MSSESGILPLRLGLIGCGEHSQENLIPSLRALRREATVKVACDIDRAVAECAAADLGCDVETDFRRLLDRKDIDAIVVAATPQVHYESALAALRRGLHVFVEKPPTVTRWQLAELREEAEARQLVTCVGHNLRHTAAAVEMQSLMHSVGVAAGDSEHFGRPVGMEMRYYASKPRGDRWGLNSPLRSFLLSHANHAIDFLIYQMGEIQKVNAALAAVRGEHKGITLSVQFIFRSGAVGNLFATSFAPRFSISGTIVSDRGRIVQLASLHEINANGISNDPKGWHRCWRPKQLLVGYDASGYATELRSFVKSAQERAPGKCHPSFADELAVYDAIDEIERIIERAPVLDAGAVAMRK